MYRTAYLHGQYQYAHTVHTVLYTLTVQLYSAVRARGRRRGTL